MNDALGDEDFLFLGEGYVEPFVGRDEGTPVVVAGVVVGAAAATAEDVGGGVGGDVFKGGGAVGEVVGS